MKTKHLILAAIALVGLSACLSDEEKAWNNYRKWRDKNETWLNEQVASGQYTKFVPEWNPDLKVYMRWLNDRAQTQGNLTPLYTSTVAMKYKGWLYEGTPFDSSYLQTDSIAVMQLNTLISGMVVAMEQMHVGDRVEIIVPYQAAYGAASVGNVPPYSVLRFDIDLRDIPNYETRP